MNSTDIRDVSTLPYPFFLRKEVFGGHPALELSELEFRGIQCSKETLSAAFSIEEKYNALVFNYEEFEKELAELAIESLVDRPQSYGDFSKIRQRIGVRIVNILTTARMYTDHLKHDIQACVRDNTDAKERAKTILSTQYDGDKHYRLMEAVRNYSQHRSLPMGVVETKGEWEMTGSVKELCEHTINVSISVKDLARDGKFKRSVLADFNEKIDLKKAIRCYVSALSKAHSQIREYIQENVNESRDVITSWRARYEEESEVACSVSLLAISVEDDKRQEEIVVGLDWDDARIQLVKKNRLLPNLDRHFISTTSHDAKKE